MRCTTRFTIVAAIGLLCAAAIAARPDEIKPGLVCEIFDFDQDDPLEDFPVIPAKTQPAVKKIDSRIAVDAAAQPWPGTDLRENFYVRWTGIIRIPSDGRYRFFLESDDGSRLFIDGKQVVDNGGRHSMREVADRCDLKAGDHEIKIEFFQGDVSAGCRFLWRPPEGKKEIVPPSVLFHRQSQE
ncbi:MAG: PA14 domain-containing protein [Planctomycetota bacterium]|nr:PA14 domain-containing protein [Planctomycetota bacterium]